MLGEVADQGRDVEDQIRGAVLLASLTVDVTGDPKVTGVGEGVGGDDDRADRSVGVPGLAQIEVGWLGRELQGPVGDVLADGQPADVVPTRPRA